MRRERERGGRVRGREGGRERGGGRKGGRERGRGGREGGRKKRERRGGGGKPQVLLRRSTALSQKRERETETETERERERERETDRQTDRQRRWWGGEGGGEQTASLTGREHLVFRRTVSTFQVDSTPCPLSGSALNHSIDFSHCRAGDQRMLQATHVFHRRKQSYKQGSLRQLPSVFHLT